ncbi:MAG: ATP-binding protein [Longimicrobiaceae bacterium]
MAAPATALPALGASPASAEVYRAIIARSSEAIAVIDPDGFYLEQNEAHRELIGYDDDELAGRTPAVHLGERTFAAVAAALRNTGRFRGEVASTTRDGRSLTLELTAFTVRGEDGAPLCHVGIKRDVTDRRRAEGELQTRYDRLQVLYRITAALARAGAVEEIYDEALAALESGLGARRASVLLFDPDGVLRFKAWRGLSDGYRAAVEGHTPWTPDTPDPRPIAVPDVARDEGLGAALQATILGEGIRALAFFPLATRGKLLGKFMVYHDQPHPFTAEEVKLAQTIASHVAFAIARRRDDEQIHRLYEAAMAANRAKAEFLAVVSHELRTPLNAILGYTELLLMGIPQPLPDDLRGHATRIETSARHLLRIIEQILAFSRLEAGREEVHPEPVELVELVHETAALMQPLAEQKRLRFALDLPDAPLPAVTDAGKLRQILLNLLSNAVKFTDQGVVGVALRAAEGEVELAVRDTGPGIAPAHLERVFEPFWQADGSRTRQAGGTGLGLSVTQRLAELLGGSVAVESTVGEGTTFRVRFPL